MHGTSSFQKEINMHGQRLREVKWLNTKYTSISKSRLIFLRRILGKI